MKKEFEQYKDRKIDFVNICSVDDFTVKVYTITNRDSFESQDTLAASIKALPSWMEKVKESSIPTYKHAFLIIHEAREGVLILLNWWTGENMIETKICFADFEHPTKIDSAIYDRKQLVCVWELEIFYHEREAWIKHVLSKSENPDFNTYKNDYYQHYARIS